MTVQEAKKYWEIFLKEIAFLKREYSSIDWEEQEQATKMAIEALEKQIKFEEVVARLEELRMRAVENDCSIAEAGECYSYYCETCYMDRAIEIVKEGMG